ncbi:MAG TPA: hypothetical protein VMZ29_09250 [Candidatus Bathyarchaeia archaeon]|nr:hypothetical protein [Candidatus Bathyarchaeia archaeon]
MVSKCPNCGNENAKFRPTTATNKLWFTCEECGEKVCKMQHKHAQQLPADAIIVMDSGSEYIDDPDDDYFEPNEEQEDLGDELEKRLAQALALAEQEKLDEQKEQEKEVKKPLLERKKQIMRELDSEPEEEEEEYDNDYPDESLGEEESVTSMLVDILKSFGIPNNAIINIKNMSQRLEANGDVLQPRDLARRLSALTSKKKDAMEIIVSDYEKALELFEEEEDDYSYSRPRTDFPRRREREPPQKDVGLVLQELQFEREINNLQRELDKRDNKIERLEDKNQDLSQELMQKQAEIRQLEQINAQLSVEIAKTSTDVKVKDIEMKYAKNYSDDSMKLTSELLDKVSDVVKETRPLSQLAQLSGRRMPSDSRIDNVAKDQDERTQEFEALTKGRASETSKALLGQQISIEDLIVDEEYEE